MPKYEPISAEWVWLAEQIGVALTWSETMNTSVLPPGTCWQCLADGVPASYVAGSWDDATHCTVRWLKESAPPTTVVLTYYGGSRDLKRASGKRVLPFGPTVVTPA